MAITKKRSAFDLNMNKILIILSFIVLASCSVKEIPSSDLVERNGIKYEVFSQVPFTGSSVSYYKKGQLHFKENFKEGRMVDGLYESYHENGQLMMRGNLKSGKRDGLREYYGENGQLKFKNCYKNGRDADMSDCEK